MHSIAIGPSVPQKLTLVESFGAHQEYTALGEAMRVLNNKLSKYDLSDRLIAEFVTRIRKDAEFNEHQGITTLVEGVLKQPLPYTHADALVILEYDFARDEPLIIVPGTSLGLDRMPNVIGVKLLTPRESRDFIDDVLLKKGTIDLEYRYTGRHRIWPGNPELKTRQIPI